MQLIFNLKTVAAAMFGLLVLGTISALAQSGSRHSPPPASGQRMQSGSGSSRPVARNAPVALEGYCPVSVLERKTWVKGNPTDGLVYDGRTYLFANNQAKAMFQSDPAKYTPALGGDCTVAWVKMRKRVPGNVRQAAIHSGRLFLFSNETAKQAFLAQPATFADSDLALGGTCPVCRLNMGRSVPGKPEIAAQHGGMRYLFPSAEYRTEFLASPDKYLSAPATTTRPSSDSSTRGSASRRPAGSGSGSGSR